MLRANVRIGQTTAVRCPWTIQTSKSPLRSRRSRVSSRPVLRPAQASAATGSPSALPAQEATESFKAALNGFLLGLRKVLITAVFYGVASRVLHGGGMSTLALLGLQLVLSFSAFKKLLRFTGYEALLASLASIPAVWGLIARYLPPQHLICTSVNMSARMVVPTICLQAVTLPKPLTQATTFLCGPLNGTGAARWTYMLAWLLTSAFFYTSMRLRSLNPAKWGSTRSKPSAQEQATELAGQHLDLAKGSSERLEQSSEKPHLEAVKELGAGQDDISGAELLQDSVSNTSDEAPTPTWSDIFPVETGYVPSPPTFHLFDRSTLRQGGAKRDGKEARADSDWHPLTSGEFQLDSDDGPQILPPSLPSHHSATTVGPHEPSDCMSGGSGGAAETETDQSGFTAAPLISAAGDVRGPMPASSAPETDTKLTEEEATASESAERKSLGWVHDSNWVSWTQPKQVKPEKLGSYGSAPRPPRDEYLNKEATKELIAMAVSEAVQAALSRGKVDTAHPIREEAVAESKDLAFRLDLVESEISKLADELSSGQLTRAAADNLVIEQVSEANDNLTMQYSQLDHWLDRLQESHYALEVESGNLKDELASMIKRSEDDLRAVVQQNADSEHVTSRLVKDVHEAKEMIAELRRSQAVKMQLMKEELGSLQEDLIASADAEESHSAAIEELTCAVAKADPHKIKRDFQEKMTGMEASLQKLTVELKKSGVSVATTEKRVAKIMKANIKTSETISGYNRHMVALRERVAKIEGKVKAALPKSVSKKGESSPAETRDLKEMTGLKADEGPLVIADQKINDFPVPDANTSSRDDEKPVVNEPVSSLPSASEGIACPVAIQLEGGEVPTADATASLANKSAAFAPLAGSSEAPLAEASSPSLQEGEGDGSIQIQIETQEPEDESSEAIPITVIAAKEPADTMPGRPESALFDRVLGEHPSEVTEPAADDEESEGVKIIFVEPDELAEIIPEADLDWILEAFQTKPRANSTAVSSQQSKDVPQNEAECKSSSPGKTPTEGTTEMTAKNKPAPVEIEVEIKGSSASGPSRSAKQPSSLLDNTEIEITFGDSKSDGVRQPETPSNLLNAMADSEASGILVGGSELTSPDGDVPPSKSTEDMAGKRAQDSGSDDQGGESGYEDDSDDSGSDTRRSRIDTAWTQSVDINITN